MPRYLTQSLALCLLFALSAMAQDKFAVTDRANALYRVNEPVVFSIDVQNTDAPVTAGDVSYVLSNDGWNPVGQRLARALREESIPSHNSALHRLAERAAPCSILDPFETRMTLANIRE